MTVVAAAPRSPFKGLAAFADADLDALFFFGREREREVVTANMLASRLTVLYGESGVGKSSLLGAAVVRDLRAAAPEAAVAMLDSWSGPVDGALAVVADAPEAYLILDQFEEYFLYHGDAAEPGSLLHDLPELLHDTRVNVLIALREDALARLDAFKARLPAVFANQIRLEHLDRDAARRAVLGPLDRWNEVAPEEQVGIESALVEAVLDECAVTGSAHDRIEAPYLQLVLERIWEHERAAGSARLRLATLRALGGAETIVQEHLRSSLATLDTDEQDVAAGIFDHLVTPSGTKIAHHASDLAEYTGVPEQSLRRVLATLERDRIVHGIAGSDRFEIFHDVLADPIRDWRDRRRLERERSIARRRHRRLLALVALSLCALAGVGALAGWALSERGTERSQARAARARELEAKALQQLSIDPNHSVLLALAATRLEPGVSAENVLRQSLIADRLRLVKHAGAPVRAVATSPRGDLVAAALSGGRVLLLDTRNRRLVRTIQAPGAVAALSFSNRGRELVTASPIGLAQVWNVSDGARLTASRRVAAARTPAGTLRLLRPRGRLASELAHVRRLSATNDGSAVAAAVAEPGGRVRAWLFDAAGRLVRVLPARRVRDVEFSPDGTLVATASADGFTTLWNARTGRLTRTLAGAKAGVDVVAFSPDGTRVASGGDDLRVWDVATGDRLFLLFGHTNPIDVLAWSPDGRVLASGSTDRTVLLWRMRGLPAPGSVAAALAGTGGAVRALAFSTDGTRLVTGGDDGGVRFWDARPDEELRLLGRGPGPALDARWTTGSIVALWHDAVRAYDPASRRLVHVLRGDAGHGLRALGAAADGSLVAAGDAQGTTFIWNERTGARLARITAAAPVTAVAVSSHGDLVASGDSRGDVRVWSRTGAARWQGRQEGSVVTASFSSTGDELVTSGIGGATLWSAGGRRLHRLLSPGGVTSAAFSPSGRLVATADVDTTARLWFAETGNLYRVLRGHTKPLTDVAFSADGRLLATASKDSDGRAWQIARGTGHVLQRGAFGPISSIAFDPSGRWIAGAAPINVILWTASSGRQLFYLRGHKDLLTRIAFAPGSAAVVSSSRDGTVRTYSCAVCVDLSRLVHMAEVRLALTRW